MVLETDVKQIQAVSPQLIQSVEVLQMDTQELRQYIDKVFQENPLLELSEDALELSAAELLMKKIDWLNSFRSKPSESCFDDGEDIKDSFYNGSMRNEPETLAMHLRYQLELLPLSDMELQLALFVTSCLDKNGYLRDHADELARSISVSESAMLHAIELVQTLAPPGVGARSLSECLQLQLERMEVRGLALTVVQSYLVELSKNKLAAISRALGVEIYEVQAAAELIRSLNPRPGSQYDSCEEIQYITPDLILRKSGHRFEICSNDYIFPNLRINTYYLALFKQTTDPELREYLLGKIRQANWIMQCVDQRQSMLLRCATVIVEKQQDFLKFGFDHLKKLSLSDVAEIVGVHESTVSRAVRGKYILCPQGTLLLSAFFSRSLRSASASNEEGVSTNLAKSVLRTLIEGEDKSNPYSDQKLSELMLQKKTPISRRTVAKYRDELNILPAAGRKCV